MAKMKNVTVYICDVCGKIEVPKGIELDPDHADDLPNGWTRWANGLTFCLPCSTAYLYGCGVDSIFGTKTKC